MDITVLPTVPLAVSLESRLLPPFQQSIINPTIVISLVLLALALLAVVYLAIRAKARAKVEAKREALRMAERILYKRGGTSDDLDKLTSVFEAHPDMDVASIVMMKSTFAQETRPLLAGRFGEAFAERIEKLYFPPPKDTRRNLGAGAPEDLKTLVEERKNAAATQAAAAIVDLMDATLKPGIIVKLSFEGIEDGYSCLVMGHDMHYINVTLPANNDRLIAAIRPGMAVEGSLESGPSLMAFTADVIQAVAGSMPYCRLSAWKTAWEVRARESVRFPITLDIDFQHIATASANTVKLSSIDKEIGSIRPGKLIDVSLGGCCIDTPSSSRFDIGDMIRFSKSLAVGSPPATLLGALVNMTSIDPMQNDSCRQRLHVQFLIVDDVSQRILVRTIRQFQDVMAREEWVQAQQLLQQMRRHNMENLGASSAVSGPGSRTRRSGGTTRTVKNTSATKAASALKGTGTIKTGGGDTARKMTGRPDRHSTRRFPKAPPRNPPE